jgi:hypothetical protein
MSYLRVPILNLCDGTDRTYRPYFIRQSEGEGEKRVFILSTPTLALPHPRGRGLRGDLKYLLLIFTVHTIMDSVNRADPVFYGEKTVF